MNQNRRLVLGRRKKRTQRRHIKLANRITSLLLAFILALVIIMAGSRGHHQKELQKESWVIKNKPEPITYIVDMPTDQAEPEEIEVYEMTEKDLQEEMYYDSLKLLAMCVEAEAGNQSSYGKRLVVDVILNRVDDQTGNWPDTIAEVITQPYQFSTYWNGAIEKAVPSEETFEAVRMELEERTNTEILFFTAEGWGAYGTPWKKVEDHYFCTW